MQDTDEVEEVDFDTLTMEEVNPPPISTEESEPLPSPVVSTSTLVDSTDNWDEERKKFQAEIDKLRAEMENSQPPPPPTPPPPKPKPKKKKNTVKASKRRKLDTEILPFPVLSQAQRRMMLLEDTPIPQRRWSAPEEILPQRRFEDPQRSRWFDPRFLSDRRDVYYPSQGGFYEDELLIQDPRRRRAVFK